MSRMTFINLPVKDLAKARAFFGSIGFSFDEEFTDENASRMIVSDDTSVMLAVEPFFKGFISPLDVADTSRSRETIVGLSAESREEVDDLVGKAGTGYPALTTVLAKLARDCGLAPAARQRMATPAVDRDEEARRIFGTDW